ncbi:MAG: TonB family protein, partial [Candidatus Aureabacteria bacterium]|nr:TonB family protein [Candidatus Auribacterota bacterium]
MKKTSLAPSMAKTAKSKTEPVVRKEEPKKPPQKEPKKKEEAKKEKAKEQPKKKDKAAKSDREKMGLKESKKPPDKKKSIEDRIKEQLEKIDQRKWVEPDKASELEKIEKSDMMATGDFTNISYNDAVASKIYEYWQTPSKGLGELKGSTVVVRFKIFRDGRVTIVKVEKSSGSEVLDRSALA